MRLIDADALVLELCQRNNKPYPNSFNHDFIAKGILRDFLVCIAEAPTIDYEPIRHGAWMFTVDHPRESLGFFACSECGIGVGLKKFNFCPNCGAKNGGWKHDEA